MYQEDSKLVARMLAGDARAFDAFFASYARRLATFVAGRAGLSEASVGALVQAALIEALHDLGRFRGQTALFAWLCAICRNELRGVPPGPVHATDGDDFSVDELARVRAAVRAEFERLHGWRARIRRWPRRVATMMAACAGLTALTASYLFQVEEGPPFGSVERGSLQATRNLFRQQSLSVGADVPSLDRLTSPGASVIALPQGGSVHVAPGTEFEASVDGGNVRFSVRKGAVTYDVH